MDNFNPYVEWLGLDGSITQPSYFQLLQLPEDVTDAAEIHQAADRAMVRVRGHKPGQQAKLWAQLLDELENAKATLGDAQLRQAYLQQFKRAGTKSDSSPPSKSSADPKPGRAAEKKSKPVTGKSSTGGKTVSARSTKDGSDRTSSGKTASPIAEPVSAAVKVGSNQDQSKTPATAPPSKPAAKQDKAPAPVAADPMAPVENAPVVPSMEAPTAPIPATTSPPAAAPVVLAPKTHSETVAPTVAPTSPSTGPDAAFDPMAPVDIPLSHLSTQAPDAAPASQPNGAAGAAPVLAASQPIAADSSPEASPGGDAAGEEPQVTESSEPVQPAFDLIGDDYPRSGKAKGLLVGGAVALVAVIAIGGVFWQFSDAIFGGDQQKSNQVAQGSGQGGADNQPTGTGESVGGTTANSESSGGTNSSSQNQNQDTATSGGADNGTNQATAGSDTLESDPDGPSTVATNDTENMTDAATTNDSADNVGPDGQANDTDTDPTTGMDADNPPGDSQSNEQNDAGPDGPTRAEIVEFGQRMADIRQLLYDRQLEEAAAQIDSAQAFPRTEEHDAIFARLVQVADLVTQFWEAVEEGAGQLESGEELKYSETTIVIIVDSQPGRITYRLGQNVTRAPREMPPGLAVLIADKVLAGRGSEGRLIKGSIYAIESQANPSASDKAVNIWEEAALLGATVEPLLAFLEDNYDLAASIVEQGPVPDAADLGPALESVRDRYREQYREATSAQKRIELCQFLLSEAAKAESPTERFVIFEEATSWAGRAGDAPLVLTSITQLGRWFELDDELTRRIDGIVTAAKANGGVDAAKEAARTALELAEEAQGGEAEGRIEDLLNAALGASRRSRDRDFQQTVRRRVDEVREAMDD